MSKISLTEEEMAYLESGREIEKFHFDMEVTIVPPCDDDHDWGSYSVSKDGDELTRRCRDCNEYQTVETDLSHLFAEGV